MKHFLNLDDIAPADVARLLEIAEDLRGKRSLDLARGRSQALVFFDPSLRTRASMDLAMGELGGQTIVMAPGKDMWNLEWRDGAVMNEDKAEHVKDAVRVLGRYADVIGVRSFPRRRSWAEDSTDPVISAFARWTDKPVVNLESCLWHPCQALADVLTIRREAAKRLEAERKLTDPKSVKPGKVLLTWGYHVKSLPTAVASSFALGVAQQGWDLTIAFPEEHDLPAETTRRLHAHAKRTGARLDFTHDLVSAYDGAQYVYAKSWGRIDRYGEDARELEERKVRGLDRWIVDAGKMALTDEARFMHCLPVRRGVKVTDEVIDGPRSIVYDQAENRLHAQKAIIAWLLGVA